MAISKNRKNTLENVDLKKSYTLDEASEIVKENSIEKNFTPEELNAAIASYKLEHSFIGILGKSIEPAIAPLGFDWKIGIALISSFAAQRFLLGH